MQVYNDFGFQVKFHFNAKKNKCRKHQTKQNTHNWAQTIILNIDLTEEAMSIFRIHPWLKY